MPAEEYDPEQYRQFVEHKNDAPGPKTPICTEPYPDCRVLLNDIRTIIHAIINEEKGHLEHLTRLLLKFDPDEYDQLS